ncbi:MAG: hypothetical protein JNM56_35630 [Planctomycetia bacterium]|nr:hypothetical protein [Planctomycetia bacterium]
MLLLGQFLAEVTAFSAAVQMEFKSRAVALYVLDNPRWLVNPSFKHTIQVAGDEPET